MQHQIPPNSQGPRTAAMSEAVEACIHCGFCLPTCPTYAVLGEEMDSPRGRIVLMKGMLEDHIDLVEGLPFVDRCLGCLACEPACPSGVGYGELLTAFRLQTEPQRARSLSQRLWRRLALATLTRPRYLRLAIRLAPLTAPLTRLLKPFLGASPRAALDLLPDRLEPAPPLPATVAAQGSRRARVALLVGCAQEALAPAITRAAIRVLARNGVEVTIPPGQGCCGALALHAGDEARAKANARRTLQAFKGDVDAILTTAAGCGSGMGEYPLLFQGDPGGEQITESARQLAERVQDVTTFLHHLGLVPPPPLAQPLTVAYHDACHLAHAQGEREAPRALLRAVPGLTLVEPADQQLCCGSAGIYNLEQPDLANQLGERKAQHLTNTSADLVASGNIGCLVQIRRHLGMLDEGRPVLHTLEVLDRAYAAPSFLPRKLHEQHAARATRDRLPRDDSTHIPKPRRDLTTGVDSVRSPDARKVAGEPSPDRRGARFGRSDLP